MQEYIEPTTRNRVKLIAFTAGIFLIGYVAKLFLAPIVAAHLKSLPVCTQFVVLMNGMRAACMGIPATGCLLSIWFARKLYVHRQFPLPGAWVWRRTAVQRGRIVMLRMGVSLVLAVLLIAAAVWQWRILGSFAPPTQCVDR